MPTLFLDRHASRALLRMAYVIAVVKEAFGPCGEGRGRVPIKTCVSPERADFGSMPAALPGCAVGEMVNVWPGDALRGLPAMQKMVKTYESCG